MKKAEKLMEMFLEAEYEANRAKWNIELSDEEANSFSEDLKQFMHSINSPAYGRSPGLFDDKDFRDFAPVKMKRVKKRELFHIVKYKNPVMGDVYRRIVEDSNVWVAYTGYDETSDKPSFYHTGFIIAETEDGLKIIKNIIFSDGKEFKNPDQNEPAQYRITDLGSIEDVLKLQEPEDKESLKHHRRI